jgi:hypothetical protein
MNLTIVSVVIAITIMAGLHVVAIALAVRALAF